MIFQGDFLKNCRAKRSERRFQKDDDSNILQKNTMLPFCATFKFPVTKDYRANKPKITKQSQKFLK